MPLYSAPCSLAVQRLRRLKRAQQKENPDSAEREASLEEETASPPPNDDTDDAEDSSEVASRSLFGPQVGP